MQMPQVTVSPRSALGALAERSVGAPGVRFESIDFNDRFDVQSSDDAFAVELIDAQMIETLLALDHGMHVVFGPEELMVYAHRKPVAEIGALFDARRVASCRSASRPSCATRLRAARRIAVPPDRLTPR